MSYHGWGAVLWTFSWREVLIQGQDTFVITTDESLRVLLSNWDVPRRLQHLVTLADLASRIILDLALHTHKE